MDELKELPEGWELVKIKDIFDFKGGGTPSKADPSFWNGQIYWASVKDIKGDYLLDTVDKITQKGAENSATNIAEPGDVILITRISPGKTITTKIRAAINQDLKIVKPKYETHSDFIKYLLKSIERKCIKLSSGTTVLGLSLNNLNEIETPFPPLPEQHRIVAKIEELFSSLDKGIENLKTAQAQLKTYRQAVLKWAFEGKLTNENVKDGELPEGWKWVQIDEIGKIETGSIDFMELFIA
ncbi:MAG: restriction endonuclease subunit S [Desulfosalsimonadaceae bacterium]